MTALLWAFVERIAPRVASALVTIVFAAVTSPTQVGYYAAMVLIYMIVHSSSDSAVRQIAVSAVQSRSGLSFLRRYSRWYAVIGPLFMLAGAGFLVATGAPLSIVLALLPMVLAPVAVASATVPTARLQHAGLWRRIALTQSAAVLTSCALAAPLVLLTHNPLGPAAQLGLSELIFALGLRRAAASVPLHLTADPRPTDYRREFGSASAFSLVYWTQAQLDRVLVGLLAGPHVLGLYTFAWSLSRNLTDALGYAVVNVVRPVIVGGQVTSEQELRRLIGSAVRRGMVPTLVVVAVTWFAALVVGPRVMSSAWDPAFRIVPLMSLCSVPMLVSLCVTPVLVVQERLHIGTVAQVVGAALSVGVALCATQSLMLAAWAALLRAVVVMLLTTVPIHRTLGHRMIIAPCVLLAAACVVYPAV